MRKFTNKEIKAMSIKDLSVDQFIKLAKRVEPGVKFPPSHYYFWQNFPNGAFLGIYRSKKGKWYRMYLKKIWIKYYQLLYRTTKTKDRKARIGREMLISSMPLPKGPVIQ